LKIRAQAAILFCAFALGAGARSQQGDPLPPPRAGFSFPDNQTLNYSVDWRVFPAGVAAIHFDAEGAREQITASAETIGAINLLFHVGDHFESTVNRTQGCTYEFDKQTVEGRRQVNSTLTVNYGKGTVVLDQQNLVKHQTKHLETSVHGCVTDLLSGIFYAASQPLELGHSFVLPVADAAHTVPVTMKVESQEIVKTPMGTFKTLRVQPTASAGVVKNRGDIWIWYTDDQRHLPVQMRARLFWGTITFRLTGIENK
jgi:hypothetical protein